MSQNIDFFRSINLFSQASTISLEGINKLAKRHFYKKSILILNDSQVQNTFLYVVKGWIKLSKESFDGDEIIIDILTDGHYCGEQFFFQADTNETYSIQAISDVEVLTLPLQLLRQLIKSDHQLTLNFLEAVLQKEQRLNMEVENLSTKTALQKIGCFLLRLCHLNKGNSVYHVNVY